VKKFRRKVRMELKRGGRKRKMKGGLGKGRSCWALIETSLDKPSHDISLEGGFLPGCRERLL
jgi:hypothetical protein